MQKLIGRSFGQYRIDKVLGAGGMGTVFLAYDEKLDRRVALKVLSPTLSGDDAFIERFNREAKFLAAIAHPNLVHVYAIERTEDGYHYMAMEYLEGISLDLRIVRNPPLPLDEAFRITGQVLSALSAVHKIGLVHRDVKPSNIMLCKDERAVLMDFGLTKDFDTPGLTREGVIAGTPEYMSPEQAFGEQLDNRSDLYSLGITLFEMLTGKVPYSGTSAIAVLRMHCEAEIPQILDLNPKLPPATSSIIHRALAKDKDDRFSDASDMARALSTVHTTAELFALAKKSAKSELPATRIIESSAEIRRPTKEPMRQLKKVPVIISAVLIAALVLGLYFAFKGTGNGTSNTTLSPATQAPLVDMLLLPAEYAEYEGRRFVSNPICQIKIDGAAPEFGRLIEITEDRILRFNPLGTTITREINLRESVVEIEFPTKEKLSSVGITIE